MFSAILFQVADAARTSSFGLIIAYKVVRALVNFNSNIVKSVIKQGELMKKSTRKPENDVLKMIYETLNSELIQVPALNKDEYMQIMYTKVIEMTQRCVDIMRLQAKKGFIAFLDSNGRLKRQAVFGSNILYDLWSGIDNFLKENSLTDLTLRPLDQMPSIRSIQLKFGLDSTSLQKAEESVASSAVSSVTLVDPYGYQPEQLPISSDGDKKLPLSPIVSSSSSSSLTTQRLRGTHTHAPPNVHDFYVVNTSTPASTIALEWRSKVSTEPAINNFSRSSTQGSNKGRREWRQP